MVGAAHNWGREVYPCSCYEVESGPSGENDDSLESTLDATINSSDDYIIGTATADDILQKLGSGSRREVIASA